MGKRDDDGSWSAWFRKKFSTTILSVDFTISEYRQRSSNYCLGLLSVIIVVLLVASLLVGSSKTPLIFMKLAEEQTGEMDMLLLKDFRNARAAAGVDEGDLSAATLPVLNYTSLNEKLNSSEYAAEVGITPRWLLTANARRKWLSQNRRSNASDSVSVTIVLIDTRKEAEIRLGRKWGYRPLGEGEAHVNAGLLRQLKIEPNAGDHIVVELDLNRVAEEINLGAIELPGDIRIFENEDERAKGPDGEPLEEDAAARDLPILRLDMDVIDAVGAPEGKYPSALGNVIVVDSRNFIHTLTEQVCYFQSYTQNDGLPHIDDIIEALPLDEYAILVNALFEDRRNIYTSNLPDLEQQVTAKSNMFYEAVGYRANATASFPLATSMVAFYFLRLFLDQIFNATIIVFITMGSILTYTLLLTNIQEKTFQHGMLRALGMPKRGLMNLIMVQALSFATPGTTIAMVLAVLINIALEEVLSGFSGFDPEHSNMPVFSIVFPILLGFLVPVMANVIPIHRAMQTTLRSALDISHQQSSETKVTLQRLEDMGLAVWQTAIACLMIVFGFMVYYMMPYAFIFNNLPVFFYMLLFIMCFLLFGLCMVTMALQSPTEHALLWLLLWGKDKILGNLVRKNLAAHRERSSKTYIMFTLSTASILFAGVVFSLQASSIGENIRTVVGADVHVWSLNMDTPIVRPPLEEFFQKTTVGIDGVPTPLKAYAFATFPLTEYEFVNDVDVSNLLDFPTAGLSPTGVDPQIMDVMYDRFLVTKGVQAGLARADIFPSLVRKTDAENFQPVKLYTGVPAGRANLTDLEAQVGSKYDGAVPVVLSAGARPALSVTESAQGTMTVEYSRNRSVEDPARATSKYLLQPRALVSKMPGWRESISSYTFLFPKSPVFMSVENFNRVLRELVDPREWPGDSEVVYAKVFVRFKDDAPDEDREAFINEMKTFLDREEHLILNADSLVSSLDSGVTVLMAFFYVISAISLLLNMFLLWVSFKHNVSMNSYAFAVMRSLGFTVAQLIRAYIYEALCTVLSAFFWGSIVGIVMAVILTVQLNMFLELPLDMDIPYGLIVVVFFEALFCSFLGSWIPAKELERKEIAHVLKGK